MQFYSRRTRYEEHKARAGKRNQFDSYRDFYRYQIEADIKETGTYWSNHLIELGWYDEHRPYFNLWPSIVSMASSLKLDIPWSSVRFGQANLLTKGLLLRFPQGHDVPNNFETVLFSIVTMAKDKHQEEGVGFFAFSDMGEKEILRGKPSSIYSKSTLRIYEDKHSTVEDTLKDRQQQGIYQPFEDFLARVLVCVSILASDPDFITPDLLSKDRDSASRPGTTSEDLEAMIQRAHRRGKVGWDIGKHVECSPHFRRPHFALRWTEKGHSVPKIVPVKGTIVKRQDITKIPTGYLGKDDQ